MDLLETAVIDISTLVVTCHALQSAPVEGEWILKRRQRNRLRRDIKRAAVAYIDTLARAHGPFDHAVLATCRLAAEQQMVQAIGQQEMLGRIMVNQAGSLDGLAATRQDLWRLAHMAIYLSGGMATLRASTTPVAARSAEPLARRLRRRFRKALITYARVTLRNKALTAPLIVAARAAALAEIGLRGTAAAQQLADIEAGVDPAHTVLRQGVARPLIDLALDWQRR